MATRRSSGGTISIQPKELPLFAIDRGIEKLNKRLTELQTVASGDRRDPLVKAFEAELPRTVEDIFGVDSREALGFRRFRVTATHAWNSGEPEHVAEKRWQSWFEEGA